MCLSLFPELSWADFHEGHIDLKMINLEMVIDRNMKPVLHLFKKILRISYRNVEILVKDCAASGITHFYKSSNAEKDQSLKILLLKHDYY